MIVGVTLALLGLALALLGWYADRSDLRRGPAAPSWSVLPAPADVARVEFPLAFAGYDPATVELHLDALARAYADLYQAAPHDVRAVAAERAALRQGVDLVATDVPARSALGIAQGGPRAGSDADALRTEAALADLETAHRERAATDPARGMGESG